jgi:SAM-dependent methyltransferase
MSDRPVDAWAAGSSYEDFMGRWSRPLAEEFIRWMDPPPGGHWLDVGTGTGALVSAICRLAEPRSVVGCDPSGPFVDAARAGTDDPRARFEVAGAGALPAREGGYDAVVSALALNFFPDPAGAVEEQIGVLRPGGWIGACVWDYAEGMEFLRRFWDAATEVDTGAAALDEAGRFPICNPESLGSLFEGRGVAELRVGSIGVPTVFADFEDYWRPFLGGTGPAPSVVARMSEDQRRGLKTRLMQRLGGAEGTPVRLTARAWAVVGRKHA